MSLTFALLVCRRCDSLHAQFTVRTAAGEERVLAPDLSFTLWGIRESAALN